MARRAPKLLVRVLVGLLAAAGVAYGVAGAHAGRAAGAGEVGVIVELREAPALERGAARAEVARRRRTLAQRQAELLEQAKQRGLQVTQKHAFALAYNGVAVSVPREQVARLRQLPGVAAVHPDRRVAASLDASVPLVGAPNLWALRDDAGRAVTGESVVVAVIDTGVDYTHAALGGGLGAGYTVVGGWDFVNGDADPMDDNGHGTHVAGIVAADGLVRGVAPDASVTAYKVLNEWGFGTESDVIAGIEAAVDPAGPHPADVVNLSLGAPDVGGDPVEEAADNAAEAGIVVVASAGNSGPGTQTVGSPGSAPSVVTVGASISGVRVPSLRIVSPAVRDVRVTRREFSANPPAAERELELVEQPSGLHAGAPVEVVGKAVLVESRWMDFETARDLETRGAAAVIFYRSSSIIVFSRDPARHRFATGSGDDGRLDALVAVDVDEATANELRAQLEAGPVRVALGGSDATDLMPDFSSEGPTATYRAKPDLVAPGVEIRSAVPAWAGLELFRLSGTSMASPHVAGAAALLRQLHPDWPAATVRAALVGTAKPLAEYGPLLQGAGRLDVASAAAARVVASPRVLSLGLAPLDGRAIERTTRVTLSNIGAEAVGFSVAGRSAARQATVDVAPSAGTIAAGGSVSLVVRVSLGTPEEDVDAAGWVEVDVAGDGADIRVPYELAVRPLRVFVSPDPTGGATEAFVYAPAELAAPPVATVRGPDGSTTQSTAVHDHDRWWRAPIEGSAAGLYEVDVRATAADLFGGAPLVGSATFEVAVNGRQTPAVNTWRPVGPNSIGGEIDFDPRNGNRVYVIPEDEPQVFISDDGARTWRARRLTALAGALPVELVVDPATPETLYVAANGGFHDPTYEGRIVRSRDGGKTWTTLPYPNVRLEGLELTPNGTLVAIAEADVYVSADNGATWEPISVPWSFAADADVVGSDLWVATFDGLYVVRNVGAGDAQPELAFQPEGWAPWVLAVTGDAQLVVAADFDRVYGSSDGGRTWQTLFEPPGWGFLHTLRVAGGNVYADTLFSLWVGRNHGSTWEEWPEPAPGSVTTDVAVRPGAPADGETWVASAQAGIYTTTDGRVGYERVGVPGVDVFDLALTRAASGEPQLVTGTLFDVYRTPVPTRESVDDETLEWGHSGFEGGIGTSVHALAAAPSDPRIVYKVNVDAIFNASVFRSDDGGATWNFLAQQGEFPRGLAVDPADPDHVAVGYYALPESGIAITNDGGRTWRRTSLPRPPLTLAFDGRARGAIWLGDAAGLHRSVDNGATFTKLHDVEVRSIAVSARDPRRLVLGGKRLYTSDDGARTIAEAAYAKLSYRVTDLAFGADGDRIVYAGAGCFYDAGLAKGGRGVLRSVDGGKTWQSFAAGLDRSCVTSLAVSARGDRLYAGTLGGGVHRIRLNRGGG